jgi:tetratricopeptide (TPR) repeat protein
VLGAALMLAAAVAIIHAPANVARAVTQLKRDMEAPAIALRDQAGRDLTNASLRERVVVLVFGELYHEKTREACATVDSVIQDARLVGQPITVVLATAQEGPLDQAKLGADHLPSAIAQDPQRRTFGAYQVAVMPSVVVIDQRGRVVHAFAGLTPRFADLLTDSLLYASGKLGADTLDRSLLSQPTTQATDAELRAERIAQLGRQLMRRGLDEMAAEKYREALELNPRLTMAHLDLGMLMLKRQRLAEAEKQFRTVLADQPNSLQGGLGLAFVQTLRGGSELDEAEKTVRALLARSPSQPRAHYLLGLIQERRGKPEDASASFKKSSELLLERAEQE